MTGNKRKNQEREGNNERKHKMKQEKKQTVDTRMEKRKQSKQGEEKICKQR